MKEWIKEKSGFLIAIAIACLFGWKFYYDSWCGVEAGQVWIYDYNNSKNPFKGASYQTNVVIEVKGMWVKYRTENEPWSGADRSDKIRWFKIGSERIK